MNKQKTIKQTTRTIQPNRLKKRLEEILILIYRFRFLSRPQIQKLLNHKSHTKIFLWLNYLTINNYIKRYYSKKFAGKPAIYSLGTNGRRYFKDFPQIKDINIPLLDRVWEENDYSSTFKKHCMFLTDFYISLSDLVKKVDRGRGRLYFFTKTDLKGVQYLIEKEPDAFFTIEDRNKNAQRYFLEIVDEFTPKRKWQYRISQYLEYFNNGLWQKNMKLLFPEIIIVCPNGYYKRRHKEFIKEHLNKVTSEISFYLTTKEEIQYQGMNSNILHKVYVE